MHVAICFRSNLYLSNNIIVFRFIYDGNTFRYLINVIFPFVILLDIFANFFILITRSNQIKISSK